MIIDAIKNGIVIDHITAGKAMELSASWAWASWTAPWPF